CARAAAGRPPDKQKGPPDPAGLRAVRRDEALVSSVDAQSGRPARKAVMEGPVRKKHERHVEQG
ncbi:MAG: hypothetical protein AB7N90_07175, partial [Vicinamibacterales bacterium]